MVNTIILSLFFSSFLAERFYFYVYHNVPTEPLLNFNSQMKEPLNINENPYTSNTSITEYIMNREETKEETSSL